jgi:hypothetical protein
VEKAAADATRTDKRLLFAGRAHPSSRMRRHKSAKVDVPPRLQREPSLVGAAGEGVWPYGGMHAWAAVTLTRSELSGHGTRKNPPATSKTSAGLCPRAVSEAGANTAPTPNVRVVQERDLIPHNVTVGGTRGSEDLHTAAVAVGRRREMAWLPVKWSTSGTVFALGLPMSDLLLCQSRRREARQTKTNASEGLNVRYCAHASVLVLVSQFIRRPHLLSFGLIEICRNCAYSP